MKFHTDRVDRIRHLDDEAISRLISGESSMLGAFRAWRHLEKCWRCRSRKEAFERTAMQIAECRNYVVSRIPPSTERCAALVASLRERSTQNLRSLEPRPILSVASLPAILMGPPLTTTVIVLSTACLLFWVLLRPTSLVSAAELLHRAAVSDRTVAGAHPGVIYQKIRITAPHLSVDREIYRDVENRRIQRPTEVRGSAAVIRDTLSEAGVDWGAPLSAESYRVWHNRQSSISDKVSEQAGGLLTLDTKIHNGSVLEETLTVRASDFHPVERTIRTSSGGTIEIAELNYAVLGWNEVNEALFEPLATPHLDNPIPIPMQPAVIPALPTKGELDGAELAARLALNLLQADEGEQISIERTNRYIEVKGVVDTSDRKQEIVESLRGLQHVKPELLSASEVRPNSPNTGEVQATSIQSIDLGPSPLERYFATRPQQQFSVNDYPEELLNAAFRVRHNADELNVLSTTYDTAAESQADDAAITLLTQSYTDRLLKALDSCLLYTSRCV